MSDVPPPDPARTARDPVRRPRARATLVELAAHIAGVVSAMTALASWHRVRTVAAQEQQDLDQDREVVALQGVLQEGVDLLEKPFRRQELLARVRAALDRA